MALLERMSAGLQLPERLIEGLANKADHAYYSFRVPKRSGGQRQIHHPSRPLKALQRWLLHSVISEWPVHQAAYAYVPGRSIKENAHLHVRSRYLLRLDLSQFFPSMAETDVNEFLERAPRGTSDWTSDDRALFCSIVCRRGRLTIGAPSSPGLSNALCFDMDHALAGLAADLGLIYSRYADDLFFSTRKRDVLGDVEDRVIVILADLQVPSDLQINREKTRHSSKRGRRQVTGLVLSSDEQVRIGRTRKRYIRRQIHRWKQLQPKERMELAGLLGFAQDVEPDFINALVLKYGHERVGSARSGA